MLPLILGLVGGGLLVSAFTEDKGGEMADGGTMAKGGSVLGILKKVKELGVKGYSKSKEYTNKQIHDQKKKVALDVIDKTINDDYFDTKKGKTDLRHIKVTEELVQRLYADGGKMAKGGVLKEEDYVWNAVGKKLIVDKVTDDEYYLTSFGQSSASPFSKKKVDGYIKSGEWSLKPKKDMMSKGETKKETMIKKSSSSKKANPQTNKFKQVMAYAKSTRKQGEAWTAAVSRAWKEKK